MPAIFAPNQLVVRFSPVYNHLYQSYQESQKLMRLQEAVRRVTGENWTIRCELSADGPTTDAASAAELEPPASNPALDAAAAALSATILKVDEGFGRATKAAPAVEPDEESEPEED